MDEILRKQFSGERISQNFGKFFFEIRRGFGFGFRAQEGSGEECARSFFGRGLKIQNNRIKIVSVISLAMYCPCLKRCTLGIRLGHFRYGYSRLGASVRANNKLNGSNTRR
jgi:hypothetical protein